MTINALMIGFTDGLLDELDSAFPEIRVTVIEEPDIWEDRGLAERLPAHRSVVAVRLARYQQDDDYLRTVAGLRDVDAVAPGTEYAVPAASRASAFLGLPGAGVPAAGNFRDKLLLRQAAAAGGMPTPRFQEVSSAEEVAAFAQGGACVVKPSARQAALGVILLDPGADVTQAWRESTEAHEHGQVARRSMRWRFMVEERLRGPEYSTECLVADGKLSFINVTAKQTLPGRRPVEIGHVVPGAADGDDRRKWADAAESLIDATGVQSAMLHAEWILTASGPVLIECAARPPGDRILDLIRLAYGANLAQAWIRLLAGENVVMPDHPARAAAVRFVLASPGVIGEITGAGAARACPGVCRVDLRLRPGDTIRETASSWDRAASIVAVAGTAADAERRAAAAAAKMTVRMA